VRDFENQQHSRVAGWPSATLFGVELSGKTIVLYDGVCGLCNRLVRFLLRHDRHDSFRFAPLQGDFASTLLHKHGINAADLNSVSIVTDYGKPSERAFTKSDAVLRAAWDLGGSWRIAELGRVLPRAMLDWFYDWVARNRYRWFGKHDTCPLPRAEDREKFVGM
jgi:predicted DCC family thiol-disulfide oxidoreductase YuxK